MADRIGHTAPCCCFVFSRSRSNTETKGFQELVRRHFNRYQTITLSFPFHLKLLPDLEAPIWILYLPIPNICSFFNLPPSMKYRVVAQTMLQLPSSSPFPVHHSKLLHFYLTSETLEATSHELEMSQQPKEFVYVLRLTQLFVSYYIMLYYIILYNIVLYYIILYYIILYYIILYYYIILWDQRRYGAHTCKFSFSEQH